MILSDRESILKRVRDCFLHGDTSGWCERLLNPKGDNENSDNSPPLLWHADSMSTKTDRKLQRLVHHDAQAAKTTHVKLSTKISNANTIQFVAKSAPNIIEKQSKLSALIANSEANPFQYYAQYESCEANPDSVTLKIVFPNRSCLKLNPSKTASIHQVIGLACMRYTAKNLLPKLNHNAVNEYDLRIMESPTGNVDDDFQPLDRDQPVGKFGFPYLALWPRQVVTVVVNLHDGKQKVLNNIALNKSLSDMVKEAYLPERPPADIAIFSKNLNSSLDPNIVLKETNVREFSVVSSATLLNAKDELSYENEKTYSLSSTESNEYFAVTLIRFLRPSLAANLRIYDSKISINYWNPLRETNRSLSFSLLPDCKIHVKKFSDTKTLFAIKTPRNSLNLEADSEVFDKISTRLRTVIIPSSRNAAAAKRKRISSLFRQDVRM